MSAKATLPAQAPRIVIKFACTKCAAQNEVAYDTKKIYCRNCYQTIIALIFKEVIPSIQKF